MKPAVARAGAPRTSSLLNSFWLQATGKDSWHPATATVDSIGWRSHPRDITGRLGWYDVVYDYAVDGSYYSGKFSDYGFSDEEYLKPGDKLEIRYNPTNPSKSFYLELRTNNKFRLICAGVGGIAGVLVVLFKLLHLVR